jgi:HNH endonuclease
MPFLRHQTYTRRQIHGEIGGDVQSYLPHAGGRVVCGCFDPAMNARAPFEIDIGNKPEVLRYAAVLQEQASEIPVFLRRGNLEWEFVGNFTPIRLTRDATDLYPAKLFRRQNAVAVLYLSEQQEDSDRAEALAPEPVQAEEGARSLRQHQRRERSAVLAEAKRRACHAESGALRCEACGLSETTLPAQIGESCFEVHHLELLAAREHPSPTTLDDLALLCANCHRMIHRSNPMLSPAELAQHLRSDA